MAVAFKGQSSGITSATLPTHAAGDLIVCFGYRDGNATLFTVPGGWTTLDHQQGQALAHNGGLFYKIAASSSETSGTWANASEVVFHVYTGAEVGAWVQNAGTTLTINFAALTFDVGDGSSWAAGFSGYRQENTTLESPPTGMVNRSNYSNASPSSEASGHDTNGGVTGWSSTNQTLTGSSGGWITYVLELKATGGSGVSLDAAAGSLALTGAASSLEAGRRLASVAGAYALAGATANTRRGYRLAIEGAAFASTGSQAGLSASRRVSAATAAYALSGASAGALRGLLANAEGGSCSVSGASASLLAGYRVSADGGAFSVTGQPADMVVTAQRSISAEPGAFEASGQSAGTLIGRRLQSEGASASVSGTDVQVHYGRTVQAGADSVAASGSDASVIYGRLLDATTALVSVAGSDADLTYTPVGAFVLAAVGGSSASVGGSAGLRVTRLVAANSSSYAIDGGAAGLFIEATIVAGPGVYFAGGSSVGFAHTRRLTVGGATVVINGAPSGLFYAPGGIRFPTRQRSGFDQDVLATRDNSPGDIIRAGASDATVRLANVSSGGRMNYQRAAVGRGN